MLRKLLTNGHMEIRNILFFCPVWDMIHSKNETGSELMQAKYRIAIPKDIIQIIQ